MCTSAYRFLDRLFFPHETAIITYHGFTDTVGNIENYHGKHLHIGTFRAHLQYLKKYYSIVSLNDFVAYRLSGKSLPPRPVVLTFDDGYESNFTLAYPVLQEFKAPATIFLTTDFIEQKHFLWANRIEYAILSTGQHSLPLSINGKDLVFDLSNDQTKMEAIHAIKSILKLLDLNLILSIVDKIELHLEQRLDFKAVLPAIHRPLTWEQIQNMARGGLVTIGAHTCSHAILANCPPEAINKEISLSKTIIEQRLKETCSLFCYPYGGPETFNSLTKACLQKTGYGCALTTVNGTNNKHSDLFTLRRLGTSNLVGIDNLKDQLLNSRRILRRIRQKFF
jgi:peptidoglycan/xylan/chitin deacetylase (PgdA/CDA1 family)